MTDQEFRDSFSARIREARHMRGLSQGELGRLTGMVPTLVSHFEAGRRLPSVQNLRRLALALKVSCDYLLGTQRLS